MNRERILELADRIEAMPHYNIVARMLGLELDDRRITDAEGGMFTMAMWRQSSSCGTVACVGGWTQQLWGSENMDDHEVGALLGLDWPTTSRLFYPHETDWTDTTPAQAARVLRHLAETGELRWGMVADD